MKKNFKKIAAVALSCVLTLGMTVNAFADAANVEEKDLIDNRGNNVPDSAKSGMKNVITNFPTGNSSSRDVTVKIDKGNEVYRVDVQWEPTKFTFKFTNAWDPETHNYGTGNAGKFYVADAEKNNSKIVVTNHSNAGINVGYAYLADSTTNGFTASIMDQATSGSAKSSGTVGQADAGDSLGDPNKAPQDVAYIVVSGTPTDKANNNDITIGTVTVTISKASSTT